jgi:hypothetical protein
VCPREAYTRYYCCSTSASGNNWDSADYSTTIRVNRYYLRIFCWALDRVIQAAYVVVCFLIKTDIGQKQWKQFLDHHSGRHDFQIQIDMALSVMNYGIGLQWDGESDERPTFMRQNPFVPCDCNKCFFCLNGITTGIAHPPTKKAKVTVEYKCGKCVMTNKCTDVRVSLGMVLVSGSYCRMCYRKQLTTELSTKERRKTSRTSAMGCPICKEPICKECRKEGYDKYA